MSMAIERVNDLSSYGLNDALAIGETLQEVDDRLTDILDYRPISRSPADRM